MSKAITAHRNFLENVLIRITLERRIGRQQNVGNYSDRPNIALARVVLLQNLWGDVIRGTDLFCHRGYLFGKLLSMAKVNQLNDIVSFGILEQDVLWLDVSVTDAQIVQVVEAAKDLSQEHGGIFLRELALPLHLVKKVAALSQ